MKKITLFICLAVLCISAIKGFHWIKQGFSLRRVQWPMSAQMEAWDKAIDRAIGQPFYYIGRGRQCFAFASSDGKYVLKLPRTDIYQIPFWLKTLPFPSLRKKQIAQRSAREILVLNSFRIGYEEIDDLTGILSLHLGETEPDGKCLVLVDPLGCKHRLAAHKTAFILQKKQPLLINAFLEALKKGDKAQEEQILGALINVVAKRGNKGIGNRDGSFLRNYGFDGENGYLIDVGTFYRRTDKIASVRDTMYPVRGWLSKTAPEMLLYYDNALSEKLNELAN